jgi:hypothetical protein
MAKKEQASIEEIIAMIKISGLILSVYPQKLTTAKGFEIGAAVTPEFVTNFDIETLVPTVSIKYFVVLRHHNTNGGRYYHNEASSTISLEKAVRNAWRRYLKETEIRNQ